MLAKGGDEVRQELLERLIDSKLVGPYVQLSFNRSPQRLPLRELPHGCWANVFLLYLAWCRTHHESPASRSTFFAVSREWRSCMRFHKRSQHQVCVTCSILKTRIRNSKDPLLQCCFLFSVVQGVVPFIYIYTYVLSPGSEGACRVERSPLVPLSQDLCRPANLLDGARLEQAGANPGAHTGRV